MSPEKAGSRGRFYYKIVIFRTENTLHRVPSYGFEKWSNSLFPDMFDLPQGEQSEGCNDENPIHLPCSTFEFESLLDVMHPSDPGEYSLSKEQWIAALKLSTCWDMPKIRGMAISRLESLGLTLIEKINIGKKCHVYKWLNEGCIKLVQDPHQYPLDQLAALGWETLAKVLWVAGEPSTRGIPLTAIKKFSVPITSKDLSCQECRKASIGSWNTKYTARPFYCTSCSDNRSEVDLTLDLDFDKATSEKVFSLFKDDLLEAKSHDEC